MTREKNDFARGQDNGNWTVVHVLVDGRKRNVSNVKNCIVFCTICFMLDLCAEW